MKQLEIYMKKSSKFIITSLEDLDTFTLNLVSELSPGTICLFYADMGVGKTTFVRSFMSHLGVYDVSSPTYTLVNEYASNPPVFHFDLYRLESKSSVDLLDLDYYFSQSQYLFFIEWAENFSEVTFAHLAITMTQEGSDRVILLEYR